MTLNGQEQHTLKPVIEKNKERYQRTGISENIFTDNTIVTADTGFANEANMKYLHENNINGYIPDNQFRSRDPKFADQKSKYGKRNQKRNSKAPQVIPASEFKFDPEALTCQCPAGDMLSYHGTRTDINGNTKAFFAGKLLQCRHCPMNKQCMQTPASANYRHGSGCQVSFILEKSTKTYCYTDWMTNSSGTNLNSSAGPEGVSIRDDTSKERIDSDKGKLIYGHRMSVVEPVFGNIGTNKGRNRFSLRTKKKVNAQWQLYCLIYNIEKLNNNTKMAA